MEIKKQALFNGLINFLENIKESKPLGDNDAHPNHINKIILPECISKKLKKEKNKYSKSELIAAVYNDNPEIESNLEKFIDDLDVLSFGRFGKNVEGIFSDYFEDTEN